MKILLFADLHMCPRASIINKWGTKYPSRLENCISSVNWLESIAEENNCDLIINLGDFFDKPDLSSETITALNDIKWSSILHYSLVGNHDASCSSLIFNSTNSLASSLHKAVTEPELLLFDDCNILLLPYVVECDRKPIEQYLSNSGFKKDKPLIILSHNDIKGIQLGPIVSKTGFSIDEIEANCELFINGHLHNGQALSNKVINLGNLTGKDFGEDAFKYNHSIVVLDTATLQLSYIENPYAYNFYKLQIDTEQDIAILDTIKPNAVLSVKCDSSVLDLAKQKLESSLNILEYRIIVTKKYENSSADELTLDLSVDHLARFIECCKLNIEASSMLEEELNEICK